MSATASNTVPAFLARLVRPCEAQGHAVELTTSQQHACKGKARQHAVPTPLDAHAVLAVAVALTAGPRAEGPVPEGTLIAHWAVSKGAGQPWAPPPPGWHTHPDKSYDAGRFLVGSCCSVYSGVYTRGCGGSCAGPLAHVSRLQLLSRGVWAILHTSTGAPLQSGWGHPGHVAPGSYSFTSCVLLVPSFSPGRLGIDAPGCVFVWLAVLKLVIQ